jgi:hypothetical protein
LRFYWSVYYIFYPVPDTMCMILYLLLYLDTVIINYLMIALTVLS